MTGVDEEGVTSRPLSASAATFVTKENPGDCYSVYDIPRQVRTRNGWPQPQSKHLNKPLTADWPYCSCCRSIALRLWQAFFEGDRSMPPGLNRENDRCRE